VQQGKDKIAVLTDPQHSPAAIARLIISLNLPHAYDCWVCENLGAQDEQIHHGSPTDLSTRTFANLNVMVLCRRNPSKALNPEELPCLGLGDNVFYSFPDRPGLMTKREIRSLILMELALQDGQIVWDIGAGTGSVSIEIARLCPNSQIYALEQTSAGVSLIAQNCDRFKINTIEIVQAQAPEKLHTLPQPDRIFIGGSGGNLLDLLAVGGDRLSPRGRIVLALATLENLAVVQQWAHQTAWDIQYLQIQLSRSIPIANLTRMQPLNPVTLVSLSRQRRQQ
jgi:precorrin-6Y C5,15-methyltransferase (decarboxylating)